MPTAWLSQGKAEVCSRDNLFPCRKRDKHEVEKGGCLGSGPEIAAVTHVQGRARHGAMLYLYRGNGGVSAPGVTYVTQWLSRDRTIIKLSYFYSKVMMDDPQDRPDYRASTSLQYGPGPWHLRLCFKLCAKFLGSAAISAQGHVASACSGIFD